MLGTRRYRGCQIRICIRGSLRRVAAILVMGVFASLSPAVAQSVQPRIPASASPAACPSVSSPSGSPANPDEALLLLRRGQQAALAGDRMSARELLAEAARLDPSNTDAAYYHARLLEELGEAVAARSEYCRFLSLPVSSADSAEVSDRLVAIPVEGPTAPHEAWEVLSRGTEYLARNDPRSAARAFSYVVHHHPTIAESYLNRAIARERMGDRGGAIRDYDQYLQLSPDAADRQAIESHLHRLADDVSSPGTVMVGMVVPGWGQFATGRPGFGLLVLAGVAGSGFVASRTEVVTRTAFFEHPFSPEESYSYEYQERVRPYLIAGIAGGAVVTIAAAIEAYLHAQSLQVAARGGQPGSARRAGVGAFLATDRELDRVGIGFRVSVPR